MLLLHTSDWHLGHSLYNYDRSAEQAAMLSQMVSIVRRERPDVFLLCGDVYHTSQPSAAVQTMLTNALVAIHEANPSMTIVITAGNHDSGSKHEIFRTPWRALGVHMIGSLYKEDATNHIIHVPGIGYIVAVPYANERNIPEGFFQLLLDEVARRNVEGLPVVLSAHTTVHGCDFTGHDHATDQTVGGIDALDISQLGQGYDYLALGHIHHAQFVHTGRHNVRYCGTPLAVTFDETFPHTVSLVEIGHHGEQPVVREVPIDNPHPLVTLPAQGMATWQEALQLLADYPADIPAYIRLNVQVDDFLPVEAHAEASKLTEGKLCRFCHINARRKETQRSESTALTVQEFQQEAPIDIARRFATDSGINFDEEMARMFAEVLEPLV